MRKEPERRYQTVSELRADVQNYLDGKPLLAGPDSVWYRLGKTIRKRAKFSALVIVSLALILLLPWISTIWMGQLTKQMLLNTNRAKAESVLFHSHFRPEARGEISLPLLNDQGAARSVDDRTLIWICFRSEEDTEVSRLSDRQREMLEIMRSGEYDGEDLVLRRMIDGELRSEYIRLFVATESCVSCHNSLGSGQPFVLGAPIGAAFVTSRYIRDELSKILWMNRIWAVGVGSIGVYAATVLIYWTLSVGEQWKQRK